MIMPKVSVIIMLDSCLEYVKACLESIVAQTLKDIEIICLNNGTEKVDATIREFACADKRIQLVNYTHGHATDAKNAALETAKGKYLVFPCQTDFFEPDFIGSLYQMCEDNHSDLAFCNVDLYNDRTGIFTPSDDYYNCRYLRKDTCCSKELGNNVFKTTEMVSWNRMFSSEFIRGNHLQFQKLAEYEDLPLSMCSFALSDVISTDDRALVHHRVCLKHRRDEDRTPLALCEALAEAKRLLADAKCLEKVDIGFSNYAIRNLLKNVEDVISEPQRYKELTHELKSHYLEEFGITRERRSLLMPKRLSALMDRINYYYLNEVPREKYKEELADWFWWQTGNELNLEHPRTLDEKIQWLKMYDCIPEKTILADKYLARKWIEKNVGEQYLVPLLGVWDSFDEIDFDSLPNQFVLKTNHGSGAYLVVRDKNSMDCVGAKKKFDTWLRLNYAFMCGLELQYLNIPPKIIAEKYIEDMDGRTVDYRFVCFNGKAEFLWVDTGNNTINERRNVYDINWNRQNYEIGHPPLDYIPQKPANYNEMRAVAERISNGFSFVRVDLYSTGDRIYFGEATFTPASGILRWSNEKNNYWWGERLKLPPKSPLPDRIF